MSVQQRKSIALKLKVIASAHLVPQTTLCDTSLPILNISRFEKSPSIVLLRILNKMRTGLPICRGEQAGSFQLQI